MTDSLRAFLAAPKVKVALLIVLLALLGFRAYRSALSDAGLNWDFANFYNTGARVFYGETENIYRYDAPIRGQKPELDNRAEYVSFPISAYTFAPLGAMQPRTALMVFKVFCLLCYALGYWLLYRHFAQRAERGNRFDVHPAVYLLLILLYEPAWRVFTIGGQSTPLVFLLLVLFLRAYTSGKIWWAALFLSFAGLHKPFLGATGLVFLFAGQWRFLGALAGTFVAEALLSVVVMGWKLHVEWLNIVLQEGSRWAIPWWYNTSLVGVLNNFWFYLQAGRVEWAPMPPALHYARLALQLALVGVLLWQIRRVQKFSLAPSEQQHWHVCWAIVFILAAPGISWEHYWAFLFIPLLYLLAHFFVLPRALQALTVLGALLTLRARKTFAFSIDQRFLKMDNVFEILLVGLYACGALLAVTLALGAWSPRAEELQASAPTAPTKSA
ncbi:MAG TPA: glycosyltransferase family 87 protein [Candidatus Nitrosotenuis sp.]|nr:glycosyltransferase family 87 protein [Candidatus Nitrosotenuis sp.]